MRTPTERCAAYITRESPCAYYNQLYWPFAKWRMPFRSVFLFACWTAHRTKQIVSLASRSTHRAYHYRVTMTLVVLADARACASVRMRVCVCAVQGNERVHLNNFESVSCCRCCCFCGITLCLVAMWKATTIFVCVGVCILFEMLLCGEQGGGGRSTKIAPHFNGNEEFLEIPSGYKWFVCDKSMLVFDRNTAKSLRRYYSHTTFVPMKND